MKQVDNLPSVSVIMPNYNGAKFIGKSIESVLAQTFQDFELLIVDDGSKDESLNVINHIHDERIRLFKQEHKGVCTARNYAISQARGEYIAFLDSDDSWAEQFLQKLTDALNFSPEAALAYCGWQNVGLGLEKGKPFIPPNYEIIDKLTAWVRNCRWPIHAAVTRRSAIEHIGGFDSRFPTSEDFLLWLRIIVRNKIVLVPEVLAYYLHHEGHRATNDQVRLAFNHLDAQWSFLRENPDVLRKLGRRTARDLTFGEFLRRGYDCYWRGDIECARSIFRSVIMAGYGNLNDWKYMMPSLLPLKLYKRLVNQFRVKTTLSK